MTFAHPYLLLLLAVSAVIGVAERTARFAAGVSLFIRAAGGGIDPRAPVAGRRVAGGIALAGAGVVHRRAGAAAADEKHRPTVKASGIDIMVALDMSGSMVSEDFVVEGRRVNRFNMARSVLEGFIDQRPDDRIGLVVFATQAFIATPLTLDHDFLREDLDRLEIGAINPQRDGHRRRPDHGAQPTARRAGEKQNRHPDDRRPEQFRQR